MSETTWIIGEIVLGIAFLGVLSAVVTVFMTRQLAKSPPAEEILRERYAKGELSREQFQQMRQDLGVTVSVADAVPTSSANGREVGVGPGTRQPG